MAVTFRVEGGGEAAAKGGLTSIDPTARLPAGSYTTLRTYGGNGVVRLGQHVRRLVDSLPLDAPGPALDPGALRTALGQALRATGYSESRVRITYAPPHLFLAVEPFTPIDEALRGKGVACVTVSARRERPEAKDTRFLATAQAAYAALPPGVHEGLLAGEDGAILEGLSSNFFAIHAGMLLTEETRVLRGVTRSMVLEVARGILPRGQGPLRVDQVASARECFITSVSREVLPVVRIDGVTIGDGVPGPMTQAIVRGFEAAVASEVEWIG